ncbi:hypothetical protein V6617_06980 [Pelagibacterium nitratireducens]|uniref:Uncharacterized protein n=1 Tax=Pelagibacterium nitratireducens TaxID=1046114 RepID=A0ABZ2I384_9HYPH
MAAWAYDVLKSEFFWGIILGLFLSYFGALIQSRAIKKAHIGLQKEDIKALAIDLVRNIKRVTDDIAEARRRNRAIHQDLLALLDVEIGIFGRVREQTIRLPDDLRSDLRKFVTDCALRKYEASQKLSTFYEQNDLSKRLEVNGSLEESTGAKSAANIALSEANRAIDDLVVTVDKADGLVARLNTI